MANGLNHEIDGLIEPLGGWLPNTLTKATTENSARINTSMLSSACWMRAESSMPR